jgi:asparagine synthase (glutamine-hydrolysing)
MCGITGFFDLQHKIPGEDLPEIIHAMSNVLIHRGPDGSGTWIDAEAGLAMGFRRLAILELSSAGNQPMVSADGRYVIVFNGEVYNFMELRAELSALGHAFRGHSDTEVMLAAICQWGLIPAVCRFNGMFAIALWDRHERHLHLIRDRMGIKPLYYGSNGQIFLFGSELKSFRAHPAFHQDINRDALALYLRHNAIPAPFTIYKNTYKLLPGTILTIPSDLAGQTPAPVPYWSTRQVVESGAEDPWNGAESEAVSELDACLRRSIRERMIADVPLGAFLSGGVDSSTIAALMQAQSSRPVQTFTIGFRERGFDEARHAREVARHLGTDHTELTVTAEQAQAVIPRLPVLYDEPFADCSQIPTFLVSELARRRVTVSLSGDGGDELFGGYNRYAWVKKIWRNAGWMPIALRTRMAAALLRIPLRTWEAFLSSSMIPERWRVSEPGEKLRKLAECLPADSPEQMYQGLVTHWKDPLSVVIGSEALATLPASPGTRAQLPDPISWMMYMDLVTYLPDDLLVKLDRASMAVSLEARVPFLDDHRVVELAWRMPMSMKIRGGEGKWLLRQVLQQYVPRELIDRPKQGFAVPIDAWLRGPLKDWAETLLGEDRLKDEGFFHPEPIRQKWQEHTSGHNNWQYLLWDILMFQAWYEMNK